MKRFADLYEALDSTTSTLAKVAAMRRYFREAPAADSAWALWFLTGRRPKRLLGVRALVGWTLELTGTPEWLFGECYAVVGDLAECIALLLDDGTRVTHPDETPLSEWVEGRILPLRGLDPEEQRARVTGWWRSLDRRELFLLNKLLTGELRVGVSATLVLRALAEVAELPPALLAQRTMGDWTPSAAFLERTLAREQTSDDASRPYPFFLASPLEDEPASLGDRAEWQAEWKWDGIRGQLIRRGGKVFLWSRGEELITERFPEVVEAGETLPEGTVLDGEVLAYGEDRPLPFALLQTRIGRQTLTPKILAQAPAAFMAYDLLEHEGKDLRERPLSQRRALLETLLAARHRRFFVSEVLADGDWQALARRRLEARERKVEGLMLKRLDSPYRTGRRRGDWWKWKIDPFQVDAVLLYAHPGNGRRANLFTDYTFAVWDEGQLVPVAKAYSGLSDEEIRQLDGWVRAHTRERFGPVRAVEPTQVFELHFEGIARSTRHKSGVAVRFPRIARWRTDKPASEADTLETLKRMISPPTSLTPG
ncbi:MAG TPA: ATP-dependent DNA ligase [Myxococcaceae bacterium]|nr:ATP-dependent DNA ligase [Myxococcaceae bacterium]